MTRSQSSLEQFQKMSESKWQQIQTTQIALDKFDIFHCKICQNKSCSPGHNDDDDWHSGDDQLQSYLGLQLKRRKGARRRKRPRSLGARPKSPQILHDHPRMDDLWIFTKVSIVSQVQLQCCWPHFLLRLNYSTPLGHSPCYNYNLNYCYNRWAAHSSCLI